MVAEWYYRKDEREHGPVEPGVLLTLARTGRLSPDDIVRKHGMKKGVPAGTVRGLSFVTPSQPASQAVELRMTESRVVSKPDAVPVETQAATNDVDWMSAFLLAIAFVVGGPVLFTIPLLLFIFAPAVLLLIPLAVVAFLYRGPTKYRKRLVSFWRTLVSPRQWRLTTTGAAAGIAVGFVLSVFLISYVRRSLPQGKRTEVVSKASPVRTASPQAGPVEFAGLKLGCNVADAMGRYGNPTDSNRREDNATHQTKIEITGNPLVKNVRSTTLWFCDDKLYSVELRIKTTEEGAALTEGQAWAGVLKEKYGPGEPVQESQFVAIGGRPVEQRLLAYVFRPSGDVKVKLKLPFVTVTCETVEAMVANRREQSEQSAARAQRDDAKNKIRDSGF